MTLLLVPAITAGVLSGVYTTTVKVKYNVLLMLFPAKSIFEMVLISEFSAIILLVSCCCSC